MSPTAILHVRFPCSLDLPKRRDEGIAVILFKNPTMQSLSRNRRPWAKVLLSSPQLTLATPASQRRRRRTADTRASSRPSFVYTPSPPRPPHLLRTGSRNPQLSFSLCRVSSLALSFALALWNLASKPAMPLNLVNEIGAPCFILVRVPLKIDATV